MKSALLFVLATVSAFAQGFAPESVVNRQLALYVRGEPVSAAVFTAGGAFGFTTKGISTDATAYTWTKTGANSATYVETGASGTFSGVFTFTSATGGNFGATGSANSVNGTFTLAPLPAAMTAAPLVNISTRATLAAGGALTPGFVVGGTAPRRVLVRAVGPALAAFGVSGPVAAPVLAIFRGGEEIARNTGWTANLAPVFAAVGAFALPAGSRDAALLLTLAPGAYTARIEGGAGEVLAEVYFVD